MTPDQIETAIRARYNADGDTFFSSALVWGIIDQAQLELAHETYLIESTYSTTSVSGTREYAFPTSTIAIRRVEYDGEKLFPVEIDDDPKTSTTEVTGTPATYSIWNNEIILYPTPSATGDTIQIYTYNEPQTITSGSTTLSVSSEYHMPIVDLALSIFYAKDGNLQLAEYHRQLWQAAVNRIKRERAKKKYQDQFAVVRDIAEYSEPGE